MSTAKSALTALALTCLYATPIAAAKYARAFQNLLSERPIFTQYVACATEGLDVRVPQLRRRESARETSPDLSALAIAGHRGS